MVAILTLATGICATTTIFSVVDSQIWRPLPFPDSERLVSISVTESGDATAREPARSQDYLAWRTETAVFQGIAAFRWSERRTLRGRGLPDSVLVRPVTEGFFRVLGKAVALGRSFEPRDAAEGGVILSDAGWRRLFNADPSIVGSAVTLDDRAHVVVGVAAAGQLEFTSDPDLFTVFDVRPAAPQNPSPPLNVFGRLADGIPIATAQAAARTTVERATGGDVSPHRRSVRVQTLREAYTGWNWRPLFFFLGAAVFVLMLGCANVANLLLARALRRQREFAIRGAIGGGRGALIRLLIVEGAVLAVVGGAAGLLAASWTLRGLPSWIPPDYVDRGGPLALDARVYLLALLLTSLTGILFGLAPMFFAVRRNLQGMLVQGGHSIGGSRLQQRVRHGFVVIEIMMALVLVVGAGLFLNSFIRLTNQPLGFEPRGRLTMSISLSGQRYEDPQGIARFASRLVERARAVAGVADAAIGTTAPLDGGSGVRFIDAHRPRPEAGKEPRAIVRAVTPRFHRVLGIVRLSGRDFTERDDITATRVAIVNERLAVRVFGNGNPIGQSLVLLKSDADWVRPGTVEIVGVVANFKEVGLNEADFSDIAVPLAQHLSGSLELIAHTTIDVRSTVDTLRHEVGVLDPSVPVRTVSTMDEAVAEASRGERFNLLLIGGFALAAVFMAGVGISAPWPTRWNNGPRSSASGSRSGPVEAGFCGWRSARPYGLARPATLLVSGWHSSWPG